MKTWLYSGIAVGLLGVTATAIGVGLWRHYEGSAAVVENESDAATVTPHARVSQVSESALARLHQKALQRFYSDPRNGYSRMPVVYDKVVKPWPELWWSPGDLERPETTKPGKDLVDIHAGSVRDFLSPAAIPPKNQPVGIVTLVAVKEAGPKEKVKNWEAKSVDLVGLLKHDQPIVYISEGIPDMDELKKLPTRPLDLFEMLGLESLQKGEELFSRSQDGVVRLLGAVRAKTDCLSCHTTKKEGDLLGAFSYTLREAEYTNTMFRGIPAKGNASVPPAKIVAP